MRYIIAESDTEALTMQMNSKVRTEWGWTAAATRHCFKDRDGEEARIIENPAFIRNAPAGTVVYHGNLDKNPHAAAFREMHSAGKIVLVAV